MGKLVVTKGDPVKGTDTHKVFGSTTTSPPTTSMWTGEFTYQGSITEDLSALVTIGGRRVALVTSRSTLDPGEDVPPTGGHSGPKGQNFQPLTPAPQVPTLGITDVPLGTGRPNAAAGSALVTVNGDKVLLDGDPMDTCSGIGATAGSKVTARNQSFVTCSA